jgi:anti-sigma B factor antagonist
MSTSPDAESFAIQVTPRDDGATVVSVAGEIDVFTSGELEAALDELAKVKAPTILNLARVHFIDSSGLRVVIQAARRRDVDGWSFAVAPRLSAAVTELFNLTGATAALPFDPTGI